MGARQVAILQEALRALYAQLEAHGEWGVNLYAVAADGREVDVHLNDIFLSFYGSYDQAQAEGLLEKMTPCLPCSLDFVDEDEAVGFQVDLRPVDEMSAALDKVFTDALELGADYDLTWELMDMA